jgi:XRE family transcriptional regulator, master regulator for biofilm formation
MRVGQRIREYRENKKMSVQELANRIGVSRSYLSRMETGERPIKTDILEKVSTVLEVPIEDFYPDDQKKIIKHNDEEIIVIDKKIHNLDKFSNEEILEFIRLGQEQLKKDVE